jgi:hypothetical protein
MSEIYFLKTGHYFEPYRGYFEDREELRDKIHSIMEKSLNKLVEEWEELKGKKWERPIRRIIPRCEMVRSIHVFKLPDEKWTLKLFPLSKKLRQMTT